MAQNSEGSILTLAGVIMRFKQCFMWCPFSCRGVYGLRRPQSAADVEEQTSPRVSPSSIWHRALLHASDVEVGSGASSGEAEQDPHDVHIADDIHLSDVIVSRENTAWSTSQPAPAVSIDASDERVVRFTETRREVLEPEAVEGGSRASSGL